MTLVEAIRKVVQDNSGGIKFVALIAHLAVVKAEGAFGDWPRGLIDDRLISDDEVLQTIRSMPELSILSYGWRMGGECGVIREKFFVYQHLDYLQV